MSDEWTDAVFSSIPLAILEPSAEQHQRWMEIARAVQQASNELFQFWVSWHRARGHHRAVRDWMNQLTAWHASPKKGRGKAPKCPTTCWPEGCFEEATQAIKDEFPQISGHVLQVFFHSHWRNWRKHPASKSKFRQWQMALARGGQMPNFSGPLPIPLRQDRTRFVAPSNGEPWKVGFRVHREGSRRVPEDLVELDTTGKGLYHVRCLLWAAVGQRMDLRVRGGSLKWMSDTRKWYLLFGYQRKKADMPPLDKGRVARLRAAMLWEKHPWSLLIDDREQWITGRNRLIAHHRRRILTKAETCRETYKAQYRPGRRSNLRKLQISHAKYKKTLTEQAVNEAVEYCREHGIGKLVWERPDAFSGQWTFLVRAGAPKKKPDSWPWHIVERTAKRVCNREGIEFSVEKFVPKPNPKKGSGE